MHASVTYARDYNTKGYFVEEIKGYSVNYEFNTVKIQQYKTFEKETIHIRVMNNEFINYSKVSIYNPYT